VEFCWIPKRSRYIYIGNNTFVVVLRIGTCKLDLWDGRTLYLHDVLLYTLEVRWNLVFVHALLQLGFNIAFIGCCVKIYLDNIFLWFLFCIKWFYGVRHCNISINDDASIYAVQNSNTTNTSDIITWHVRLWHIWQDQLYRLTRAGLLGLLTKKRIICLWVLFCWKSN
jgi:hypothetical protein